ncbi:MAG: hypothetical protein HYZ37_19155 [Candidatus Solibacter usitatus]|nr:hypothetical protein [Candidatus Solibacter usitatus]
MPETIYRGRRAWSIENEQIRVTLLVEGGHLAELLHKPSGVNPMWTPPWPSVEPSKYDPAVHAATFGDHAESKLLAGIIGHNLCMDIFGGPSAEEAAAGLLPHGEGSIVAYDMNLAAGELVAKATFPMAQLAFERRISLSGHVAVIKETVQNLSRTDKATAWTQHATLGPPFLEKGKTLFRLPGTRSRVYETDFAGEFGRYQTGADFQWPMVPLKTGGELDLRVLPDAEASGGYTAHLMDPRRDKAFFTAWTPSSRVVCGYAWHRADFPWLGIWEENYSRKQAPWNGKALTRGMEFGVSPMPESRRQMIERGSMFGTPGFRWIPALSRVTATYCAFVTTASAVPESLDWDGAGKLVLK